MRRNRRRGAAAVMTAVLVAGMLFGYSSAAAGPKVRTPDPNAQCTYLLGIITYPFVNLYIRIWATSLYNSQGCQPALR